MTAKEEKRPLLYFAYGEHMNEKEMLREFPHARMVGLARLKGYGLCFVGRDGAARAALEFRPSGHVVGRLWTLREADAETLDTDADAPYFARGELRPVRAGEMEVPALVYITVQGQQRGRPGFVTYDVMREAYASAGQEVAALQAAAMRCAP